MKKSKAVIVGAALFYAGLGSLTAMAQDTDAVSAKADAIVAKDVKDIIAFGGKIAVKDSKAKILGGAAGIIETDNSSFDTVLIAAGSIQMRGGTSGEINAAAGKIEMGTTVTGDLGLAGGEIILEDAMTVGGDTEIHAGSVEMTGTYSGDVAIDGESVKVGGKIGGDLKINARRVVLLPGTIIGGNLKAPTLADVPEGVTVGGKKSIGKESRTSKDNVTARLDEAKAKLDEATAKLDGKRITIDLDHDDEHGDESGLISPSPIGMGSWLTILVTLAACGALALGVAPQFVVRATERLAKEPLPSLSVGLLSLVAVPAALIAVGITIIGIPFAILGAAAYMIGIGLGLIALCLWGGLMVRTLANQPGQETRLPKLVGWTLMGFLALALLGAVPFVGRWIQILAVITGAGAVLSTAWSMRRKSNTPSDTALAR